MMNMEEQQKHSLVLTIFKGQNFVYKRTAGFRLLIEAKCGADALYSGVIPVSSTNTEPEIASQLAWTFARKQLKELREQKTPVKVRCFMVGDDSKRTEFGYTILHVRDALVVNGSNVNAAKAHWYPLLGTKEEWKTIQPKLLMQLHVEDHSSEKYHPAIGRKETAEQNIDKVELDQYRSRVSVGSPQKAPGQTPPIAIKDVDKSARTQMIEDRDEPVYHPDPFDWQISQTNDCFQLGQPTDFDDLYSFNITIVSVSNLHVLWDGRSPKRPSSIDYVWQIRYKAYGCEIKSDPFLLNQGDSTKRTFIGDKATARIRASAPVFCDYLENTTVEFHIVRFRLSAEQELVDQQVMGICYAPLEGLAKMGINELRHALDVVSEWGYPKTIQIQPSEKPEMRVVFQLEAKPGFFSQSKTSIQSREKSGDTDENANQLYQSDQPQDIPPSDASHRHRELETSPKTVARQNQASDLRKASKQVTGYDQHELADVEKESKPLVSSKSNLFSEEDIRDFLKSHREMGKDESPQRPHKEEIKSKSKDHSVEEDSYSLHSLKAPTGRGRLSQTDSCELDNENIPKVPKRPDATSSISSESSGEDSHIIFPNPGTYKITICLEKFWLKSRSQWIHDVAVSYVHPRFYINEPVTCTATTLTEVRSKTDYYALKLRDEPKEFEVFFEKFSEKTLNEPMTVEYRTIRDGRVQPMFGFSMLPIGNVLVQEAHRGTRVLEGEANILKSGSNIRVGKLNYKVMLVSASGSNETSAISSSLPVFLDITNISPIKKRLENEIATSKPQNSGFPTSEELQRWTTDRKEEFENQLKEKEHAYLKLLSEEASARDKQREKTMTEKLNEIKKKQKELEQFSSKLAEKEDDLRKREMELFELEKRTNLDNAAVLENAKITMKRMQEEHKIEISSLRRRHEEYEAQLTKFKGKLEIMEAKLEEKNDLIHKLKSEGHERPNAKLYEEFKLYEHENKLLKKQIATIEQSREQYKKQAQTLCMKLSRLQEERDRQLKDENENLRLQILASMEHKRLKKDRKETEDYSQKLRTMQENSKSKDKQGSPAKQGTAASSEAETEIKRLTDMRNNLLTTGAYTKYDTVIKEMERRIVGLAEGKLKPTPKKD